MLAVRILGSLSLALRASGLLLCMLAAGCLIAPDATRNFLSSIVSRTPGADLLTTLAGIYGGLIAVVVPLSYTIINQISERYGSDVVSRLFAKSRTVQHFPRLLLVALASAVVSEFFVVDTVQSLWPFLAWAHLVLFFALAFWLKSYFMLVLNYMDSEHLLEELRELNVRAFASQRQNDFIRTTQGIGDVLVYETARRQDDAVQEGLTHLRSLSEKMVHVLTTDEQRALQIAVSPEYAEAREVNKFHAGLMLLTSPQKVFSSFSAIINQFVRVVEAAVSIEDRAIASTAMEHLTWLQKALAQSERTDPTASLQDIIFDIYRKWLQDSCETKNKIMAHAISPWYRKSVLSNQEFHTSWLVVFNCQLFSSFQVAAMHGDIRTFRFLVDNSLNQYAEWPELEFGEIGSILYETDRNAYKSREAELAQLRILATESTSLYDVKAFDLWQERVTDTTTRIANGLPTTAKCKIANEVAGILSSARKALIIYQMRHTLFLVGAYCLFKEQFDCIKLLWDAHQPSDTKVTYVGADLIPETLQELFGLYFAQTPAERERGIYWEGRHSSERYQQEYFLVLLAKLLVRYRNNDGTLEAVALTDLGLRERNRLKGNLTGLSQTLHDFTRDRKKCSALGFTEEDVTYVGAEMSQFLGSVSQTIESLEKQALLAAPISVEKVTQTRADCERTYQSRNRLMQLFAEFGRVRSYQHQPTKFYDVTLKGPFYKELFIQEWYMPFSDDIGRQLGELFASKENAYLAEKIVQNCLEASRAEFEETLLHTTSNTSVLLAGFRAINALFSRADVTRIDAPMSPEKITPSGYLDTKKGTTVLIYKLGFPDPNTVALVDTRSLGYLGEFGGSAPRERLSLAVEPLAGQQGQIGLLVAQSGLSADAAEKRREELELMVLVQVQHRLRYAKRKSKIGIFAEMVK